MSIMARSAKSTVVCLPSMSAYPAEASALKTRMDSATRCTTRTTRISRRVLALHGSHFIRVPRWDSRRVWDLLQSGHHVERILYVSPECTVPQPANLHLHGGGSH